MAIYFAPMEGLTDDLFRRAHKSCFSGVNKYFIPFVAPTQHCVFTPKERTALLPENNAGLHAVPQVLTKNSTYFLWAAQEIAQMGYTEVNLNLGCPSPTVVPKGKGAGMLRDPDALKSFLDDVFDRSPLPVSIKTRIGFESPDEWPALLAIFRQYPLHELIIHTRTRSEYYKGETHPDAFAAAQQALDCPLCYNGDLFTAQDLRDIRSAFPEASLMIGRGAVSNPALAQEATGGPACDIAQLQRFHDTLIERYRSRYSSAVVLGRMRDVMKMIALSFSDHKKPLKALCKARTEEAYLAAVQQLFDTCTLHRERPEY